MDFAETVITLVLALFNPCRSSAFQDGLNKSVLGTCHQSTLLIRDRAMMRPQSLNILFTFDCSSLACFGLLKSRNRPLSSVLESSETLSFQIIV